MEKIQIPTRVRDGLTELVHSIRLNSPVPSYSLGQEADRSSHEETLQTIANESLSQYMFS